MICPSCGRETDSPETCAHCGATLLPQHRLPLGIFKWASLLLAIAGVIALLVSASHTAAPQIAIGEIGATMNLAYVRVSGTVISSPKYDPDSGYLSFRMDDGTGELTVSSYRAETQALVNSNSVPALGDRIALEGTLRLREDSSALTLVAPERLTIERPAPVERAIGSLSIDDDGLAVLIRGQVRDVREPYPGLTLYTLGDASGEMDAALYRDTISLWGEPASVAAGDSIQVNGVITLYRDTPQLIITTPSNIQLLAALQASNFPFAPTTSPTPAALAAAPTPDLRPTLVPLPPCADATCTPVANATVGQSITAEGQIVLAESYAGGFRFGLRDSTGTITLLLPESIYKTIPALDTLRPGAVVRAAGRVAVYQGDMQLEPASAANVSILVPGQPSDELPIAIGQIALGDVNDTLTVEGNITAAETFSQGLRVTVTDDTGSITLLLWQNVLNYVPASNQLQPGPRVRVTGLIQEYKGALEIVPQIGFDVIVSP